MKLLKINIFRMLLKLFYLIPIKKNKILFICHYGKYYGCNPKYIFEKVFYQYSSKLQYVWVLNKEHTNLDQNVIQVKNKSIFFFYHILTAKVIISNNALGSYIPKRKGQTFINTWHGGGAYKRVHFDIAEGKADKKVYQIFANQTDYHLSSSKLFTKCMSESTNIPKMKFLEFGMPRNDYIIKTKGKINEEEKRKLVIQIGIPKEAWGKKFVLYAPTFRGKVNKGYFNNFLEVEKIIKSFEERFGGSWVLLFRSHQKVEGVTLENCIVVNDYEDMQHILLCSDALITDFSSVMWDFMFLQRPGFLFIPDLKEQLNNTPFYTPVDSWPFSVSITNDELCMQVKNFAEDKAKDKIEEHKRLLGNKDNGNATLKLLEFIKMLL